MTITDAIRQVLTQQSKPLTAVEIYEAILEQSLFEFNSKSAASIVRGQIRRHCEGVQTQSASAKKIFRLVGSNRYELLDPTGKLTADTGPNSPRSEDVSDKGKQAHRG